MIRPHMYENVRGWERLGLQLFQFNDVIQLNLPVERPSLQNIRSIVNISFVAIYKLQVYKKIWG